jgi:hypothetical protein
MPRVAHLYIMPPCRATPGQKRIRWDRRCDVLTWPTRSILEIMITTGRGDWNMLSPPSLSGKKTALFPARCTFDRESGTLICSPTGFRTHIGNEPKEKGKRREMIPLGWIWKR